MSTKYILETTSEFMKKLDIVQGQLQNFSQKVSERRAYVFHKIEEFERYGEKQQRENVREKGNEAEKAVNDSILGIRKAITEWRQQVEKNTKGIKFMKDHEKYLVVMVFGAVKAGKSSIGNFFAGKYLKRADFDNIYKNVDHPAFAMQEKAREEGDVIKDKNGDVWFKEGVTDTTGAIQYFTLSGLRWMDTPGTGALSKEHDKRNMEEMVKEYLPFSDLCVFLMNSSEPGLQDDMKYINDLSRDGQEALVLITKSDVVDEDEDAEGNIIRRYLAKPASDRKLQEDDICKRIHEKYPEIPVERYKALSVSTLVAKEAIAGHDEELYKSSNLDIFMKLLGDKASADAVRFKERMPKKNLNIFIDKIINGTEEFQGIAGLEASLQKTLQPIKEYKEKIEERKQRITKEICSSVKRRVAREIEVLNKQVESSKQNIDAGELNSRIRPIVEDELYKVLNESVARIVVNYQQETLTSLSMNLQSSGLKKQYRDIEQKFTKIKMVRRNPDGIWENFRSLFGKTYYDEVEEEEVVRKQVDIGTNKYELLDSLEEQITPKVSTYVAKELEHIRDSYFLPQEVYVKDMQKRLQNLKLELEKQKFELRD